MEKVLAKTDFGESRERRVLAKRPGQWRLGGNFDGSWTACPGAFNYVAAAATGPTPRTATTTKRRLLAKRRATKRVMIKRTTVPSANGLANKSPGPLLCSRQTKCLATTPPLAPEQNNGGVFFLAILLFPTCVCLDRFFAPLQGNWLLHIAEDTIFDFMVKKQGKEANQRPRRSHFKLLTTFGVQPRLFVSHPTNIEVGP